MANERIPAVREAIEKARAGEVEGATVYLDPEAYLQAVACGRAVPDAVRVAAARALLPYLRMRQRAPLRGRTPRELDARAAREEEDRLLEEWAEKARKVRARLARG